MNRREQQELNDWLEGRSSRIPTDEETRAEWLRQSIIDTLLLMQQQRLGVSDDFNEKLGGRIKALEKERPEEPPLTDKRRKRRLRSNQRPSLDWRPIIGSVAAILLALLLLALLQQPAERGFLARWRSVFTLGRSIESGPAIGTIDRMGGLVQLGSEGGANEVTLGSVIREGVRVVCPPGNNRVRIRAYSGAILDVESGTVLRLHENRNRLRIDIDEGSLLAEVRPGQKALVITSPIAEVSATDTAVTLSLQPGSTRVTVDDGTAMVRNLHTGEELTLSDAESVVAGESPGLANAKVSGARIELPITSRYLLIPIGGPRNLLRVAVDEQRLHALDLNLATSTAAIEWWTYLDLDGYQGRTATVTINGGRDRAATEAVLMLLKLADTRPIATPVYGEKLRPQLRFSQLRGHACRPSGLTYYAGEYHLFWQAALGRFDSGARPYWGHAVSTDLIHWRELEPALRPSGGTAAHRRRPDAAVGSCWPGTAHVDVDNLAGWNSFDGEEGPGIAMVVAYTDPAIGGVAFAYSTDHGRRWRHCLSNPVLRHVGRDPKLLWHAPSQRWVMVIADDGSPPARDKPGLAFYLSRDLREWALASRLPGTFRSPDLFELGVSQGNGQRRWVLFSQDGRYLVGDFDGTRFVPEHEAMRRVHWGRMTAPQTFSNSPDGRIIQMAGAPIPTPGMPFQHGFSLPMHLSLRKTIDGLRVFANPIRELEQLRRPDPVRMNQQVLGAHADASSHEGPSVMEFAAPGENYDLLISVRNRDARRLTVSFAGGAARYDFKTQELEFGDWTASDGSLVAMPLPAEDGYVSFRLLIDRAGYDLIGGNGRCYATSPRGRLNRHGGRPLGKIRLAVDGGTLTVESLRIYAMRSIWR